MNYTSTITVEPKIEGWDGVRFTIRKLSEGVRIAIRRAAAGIDEKQRAAYIQLIAKESEMVAGGRLKIEDGIYDFQSTATPEDKVVIRELQERIGACAQESRREHVLAMLARVDGLMIDGKAATAQALIEAGPQELYEAAVQAVYEEVARASLSEEERKNSGSPTISAAVEGGSLGSTTAGNASATAIT